ncbi:DUF938 domain-containing protein [Pontixanthobacter gangjinensis]|uniref:DUF938 domain-containing protein n=1 Tax=Pontixanthobacter gangjinensis TaxID=1028742 RepID=A0A6I4SPD8_9SPHN|nr:DUF938 domain-containing protein [Pontixanthobacter gangjinensis]MXO57509.1 DUF938 domain-containing protein [Pontixanthobacter gangjinensis]
MKRHAPATARNSRPIANVLQQELPEKGLILEVASGTGEHVVFFARLFPALNWQPSDHDLGALSSITEYVSDAMVSNIHRPIALDAASPDWPMAQCDAVLCINMVHISPWDATIGLFRGAASILPDSSPLIIYGPFIEENVETADSNVAFHRSLVARNGEWGLRNLPKVDALAEQHGFTRIKKCPMPANNLMLIYRKKS